jgi:hypothetical protein
LDPDDLEADLDFDLLRDPLLRPFPEFDCFPCFAIGSPLVLAEALLHRVGDLLEIESPRTRISGASRNRKRGTDRDRGERTEAAAVSAGLMVVGALRALRPRVGRHERSPRGPDDLVHVERRLLFLTEHLRTS